MPDRNAVFLQIVLTLFTAFHPVEILKDEQGGKFKDVSVTHKKRIITEDKPYW